MATITFHNAADRCAAIRRELNARRADRDGRVQITVCGGRITLDGVVDSHADKRAALDAALLAGEAEVVIDRMWVSPPVLR